MTNTSLIRPAAAVLAVLAFAACGGSSSTSTSAAPAPAPAPASAAPAASSAPMRASGGLPSGVSAMMVAQGDSLYHARNCKTCHGADAKGAANGPNLTTGTFTHISGSYDDIVKLITDGVPKDQIKDASHQFAMRPRGGSAPLLTDDQVKAIAAYVYTLSHK